MTFVDCPYCHANGIKNTFNPIFMVHDDLWKQSGMERNPCILCFERAIGRRLKIEDLKPSPMCNHDLPVSWFLGDRPFGQPPTLASIGWTLSYDMV